MFRIGLTALLATVGALLLATPAAASVDDENCLMCHRYPTIGRYDEDGHRRVFYVAPDRYARSVHGVVSCTDCHEGLDTIPHTDVQKVDCAKECHVTEPSRDRPFSHGGMITKYEDSVHGRSAGGEQKAFPEDLPTCKYCHTNRELSPGAGWGGSPALATETLARCAGCHPEDAWAERSYAHFTHRMRRRRSQSEVVELCTSCHEDADKMARHGLESVETFKDTFHWTQVKYGVSDAPDCISCHVPMGYSTHDIRPRTDPISPINFANRVRTCSNDGGVQSCHPAATERFAKGRVHAYGLKAALASADPSGAEGDDDETALVRRAAEDMSDTEVRQFRIIELIKLIYKLLIAATIVPMLGHNLLDLYRIKRSGHGGPGHV